MLKELRKGWDEAARTDPLFNILTEDDKAGGGWDVEEFFERGRRDVGYLLERLREEGFAPKRRVALDFGCGVGRCTQALADHFKTVYGVDISSVMIQKARRYDRGKRCVFRVNGSERLKAFKDRSCDFVYSQFVLQHMDANLQWGYIREFIRVLRPGGVAAFIVGAGSASVTHAPWRSIYGLDNVKDHIMEIEKSKEITAITTEFGSFWIVRKATA